MRNGVLFLCKRLMESKLNRALPLSRCKTYSMDQAFFLCLGKLSHSFLYLDRLPAFCPAHFQCCEISPRFSLLWSFCQHLHPESLSLHIQNLSKDNSSNVSTISSFFSKLIYVWVIFHLLHSHFLFLCYTFIFIGYLPLLSIYFCKMSCGFVTGSQGGSTSTRFAVCVWTDNTEGLKDVMRLITDHDAHLLLCGSLCTAEQAAEVVPHAITHS